MTTLQPQAKPSIHAGRGAIDGVLSPRVAPASNAQQGHRYEHAGREVLALSSGEYPRVAAINRAGLWPLGSAFVVNASSLVPLAMAYFYGQVPS